MRKHIDTNTEGSGKPGREKEIMSEFLLVQAWDTASLIAGHKGSDAEKVKGLSSLGV